MHDRAMALRFHHQVRPESLVRRSLLYQKLEEWWDLNELRTGLSSLNEDTVAAYRKSMRPMRTFAYQLRE